MSGHVIGYCTRCATDVTATEYAACACPKDRLVPHNDEPCPHDCAIGVGTITTSTPEWAGTIWECTSCHAIGKDTADNSAIVWTEADQ